MPVLVTPVHGLDSILGILGILGIVSGTETESSHRINGQPKLIETVELPLLFYIAATEKLVRSINATHASRLNVPQDVPHPSRQYQSLHSPDAFANNWQPSYTPSPASNIIMNTRIEDAILIMFHLFSISPIPISLSFPFFLFPFRLKNV